MFYILHGQETFTRAEQVNRLRDQVAQDGMGDLNITVLDGRSLSLGELMNACNTIPFLTPRRLVIVENMLQRYQRSNPKGNAKGRKPDNEEAAKLLGFLPEMPDSTRLVFSEDRLLGKSNLVLKGAAKIEGGYIKAYSPLEGGNLQRWVMSRCQEKGAAIDRSAVIKLTSYVGNDLRLIDQELEKLAAFVNYDASHVITEALVDQLVPGSTESNIFALVDALGMRQGPQAIAQLELLLSNGANELYLLAMLARQVRLLISVKDLTETQHASPDETRKKLRISHRFILDKLLRQAMRFTPRELESLLRRILELDQAIKTGRSRGPVDLEILVLDACRQRRRHASPTH